EKVLKKTKKNYIFILIYAKFLINKKKIKEFLMEIKGSVAIITGGGNGIGEAVAKRLASDGAKVVLADMNEDGLKRVQSEIKSAGGEAITVQVNVTKEDDTAKMIKTAIDAYGKLNIMVPCAGIIKDGMLLTLDKETGKVAKKMTLAQWQAVLDVNLTGTFLSVRDAAEAMVNTGSQGVIFTISSVNKVGQIGQLNYSSTKVSDALFPKILIGEFNKRKIKNIRVVGIAPGYVGTPMVKGMDQKYLNEVVLPDVHLGRLIEPEEIADLITYICKNEAINATTIEITGGLCHTGGIAK
ncbi:MAG TPA: hypothetical protein DHW82_02550, partial [Spirochaetia bacterium]|nr:hypothetical protein [Spirochaetia bacterium]